VLPALRVQVRVDALDVKVFGERCSTNDDGQGVGGAVKPALLPGSPSQPAHEVEMGVAAHDRHRMLPAERCDPNVVRRNRVTSSLQFQPDGRVMPRGLNSNIEYGASVQHSL
jgi:hypothetical protein